MAGSLGGGGHNRSRRVEKSKRETVNSEWMVAKAGDKVGGLSGDEGAWANRAVNTFRKGRLAVEWASERGRFSGSPRQQEASCQTHPSTGGIS